ncbi:oligosaccharide repeat unit polymerase [Thioalkalivibrio versutus]|uniref:oligosaccharide repeat unit polymerase n=1 Tax=Thioalkalivibrio versutus TaxID=106634 RepID=UPI00117E3BBB|nr:oligosaccharide repeat unit polymerase [Thioalkalivibrio versutus]
MNIVYSKSLIMGAMISIPWLLMASGGIVHLQSLALFLLGMLLSCAIFIYSFVISGKTHNVADKVLVPEKLNLVFLILFAILLSKTSMILADSGFNPQHARNVYFSDMSVWGSVYVRMVFAFVVVPFYFLFLLSKKTIKPLDYLTLGVFLLANLSVGSRFVVYHIALIFILRSLVGGGDARQMFRVFFWALILLSIGLLMGFARSYMSYDLSPLSAIGRSFTSLYNYHSIQFGVFSFYPDSPSVYGPLTGLLTPFYTLAGGGSPESNALTFLHGVEFSDNNYNAFGTSAFYFGSFGYVGFVAFFFSYAIVSFFLYYYVPYVYRVYLVRFLLFSLYFSAFTPQAFGFGWWLVIFYFAFVSTLYNATRRFAQRGRGFIPTPLPPGGRV